MNFNIINGKSLGMEFKKTTKIWHTFLSLAGTQRYKRGFVKKKTGKEN